MILIKRLEVSGFRLFDNAKLDFNNKKGLVSLKGVNKDFFESNGSGKSSLPSAISQILYGENLDRLPQKYTNSIYSKEKFRGYLELEINDKKVEIERDYNKNTFDYWVDGVICPIAGKGAKQVKLDEIIGLSFSTFSKLFYLSPNRISLFSRGDDINQSKFIKELLSLEFISDINKRAESELKLLKSTIDMKIKEQNLNEKHLVLMQEQLKLVQENAFDIGLLMKQKEKLEEVVYNKKKLVKEQQEYKKLLDQAREEYDSKTVERRLRKETVEENSKLLHIEVCPTCKQKISAKEEIKNMIKDSDFTIESLNKEIATLFGALNKKISVNKGLETKISEITKEEIIIEQDIKRMEILKQQGDTSDKTILRKRIKKEIEETTNKIVQTQNILKEFRDRLYVLDLIKASTSSKGFIKQRIQLFIELMNNQLSKLSTDILGGETMIEIIKSEKDSFEVQVQDSKGRLGYNNLSSGTKARVDILLSLALNLSIKALTGIEISQLYLDECFSSIDGTGKKDIESLLMKVSAQFPNTMLIVVLHGENLASDHTIIVTRENYKSTLSWG